jgi:hypothetical protein
MTYIKEICKSIEDNDKLLFRSLLLESTRKLPKKEYTAILDAIKYKRINYLKALLKDDRFAIGQEAINICADTNFKLFKIIYFSIKQKNKNKNGNLFFGVFNQACYIRNIELVKFFIENETNIYSYDNSTLQIAARDNNLEVIKLILNSKQYKHVSQISRDYQPINIAFKNDNFEAFKLLCEAKYEHNYIKRNIVNFILPTAIRNKKNDFVDYILNDDVVLDYSKNYIACPLISAVHSGNLSIFKKIFFHKNLILHACEEIFETCIQHQSFDIADFIIEKNIYDVTKTSNKKILKLAETFISPESLSYVLKNTDIDFSLSDNRIFRKHYKAKNYNICSILFFNYKIKNLFSLNDNKKYNAFFTSIKINAF